MVCDPAGVVDLEQGSPGLADSISHMPGTEYVGWTT